MPDLSLRDGGVSDAAWVPPHGWELFRWPLSAQGLGDRLLTRLMAMLARRHVLSVTGITHIAAEHDPFILAANHTSRREALTLPAVLALLRRGRLVHFLGDWNFRLFPGLNLLYRRSGTITVSRKPARWRPLDRLKPLYADPVGALHRARKVLGEGRPVGIFPEGTVNRDPANLLPGHPGAAFLSLRLGVPVVPVGISLGDEIGRSGRRGIRIAIGAPLDPRLMAPEPIDRTAIAEWHAVLMRRIAQLAGKDWADSGRMDGDDQAG